MSTDDDTVAFIMSLANDGPDPSDSQVTDATQPLPTSQVPVVQTTMKEVAVVESADAGIDDDFRMARDNIVEVTEVAKEAITELADIARQSQHPRAYEVLAGLIKTVIESQNNIVDLHQKRKNFKDGRGESKPDAEGDTINDNRVQNVFVGTPSELQKLMNNRSHGETIEVN